MNRCYISAMLCGALVLAAGCARLPEASPDRPVAIDAGRFGKPPSDATILYDGGKLEGWTHRDGTPAQWKSGWKTMTVKPGAGDIISTERFRDAHIHVEFATPLMRKATGQDRGNSGVYIQGRYEVQVLDSYGSETYADGQCGAIYGQAPPLVNASRPPRKWQTYDIFFHAAKFDGAGAKTSPARVTVLHNGVLIHYEFELSGDNETAEPGPLLLQDHGNKVRYRNIWLRPLAGAGS